MNFNNMRLRSLLVVLVYSFAVFTASAKGVFYVKEGAEGDGSSWSSAFGNIQQAVDSAAKKGADVWVAKGTYTSDASAVVNLKPNVSLYGGFAGTETSLAARDTAKNPTILDGDGKIKVINQDLSFADGAAVVVDGFTIQNGYATYGGGAYLRKNTTVNNCIFKNNTATYYGLAIYANNAKIKNTLICNNSSTDAYSTVYLDNYSEMDSCVVKNNTAYYHSGLCGNYSTVSNTNINHNKNLYTSSYSPVQLSYSSKLINSVIENNYGAYGGIYIYSSSSVKNSKISNNVSARYSVAHIDNYSKIEDSEISGNESVEHEILYVNSSSRMDRCKVFNNVVDKNHNIVNIQYSSVLSNSLFYGNTNVNSSSVPLRLYNEAKVINTTFVDNETSASTAVYSYNSSVANSILVGTKFVGSFSKYLDLSGSNTFSHSMIEGGVAGEGNISGSMEAAAFADPANGDYSLSENSFCINAGASVSETLDLLGNARTQGDVVDMGAIESAHVTAAVSINDILYVKQGSKGDGTSWKSAFGDVNEAIKYAARDGKKHQIWVAAGTYYGDTTAAAALYLEKGISLYGGFAGDETSLASRDTAMNPTILDGKGVRRVIGQKYGFASSMAVVIDGFTIKNGTGDYGGGANVTSNVTINNCNFTANKASREGSALYASNSIIKNSQFFGNTYTSNLSYTVHLYNCEFDSCVVKNNKTYYNCAVYAENKSTVSNCEFTNNSSYNNSYRASVFNASTVTNCKFVNTSECGAAELQNATVMRGCLFEGNTNVRTYLIYSYGDNSVLEDCQVQNNSVVSTLMYFRNGKVNRCIVKNNSHSYNLMDLRSSSVSNSLFCNNTCANEYVIFNLESQSSLINCTAVGNQTKSGNVVSLNNSTLRNSIIVGNTTAKGYSNCLGTSGTNTIVNNMLESTFVVGNIDGSMKYAAFADPENGDYSLSENSYCINAGSDVADLYDVFGKERKQGGAVDMGAIESAYTKSAESATCGEIVYVKSGSEGDGSSWKSAFGDIQEAIFVASADGKKHQIWVAAGTYYGDSTISTVVNLASGISLYGGFAGTETSIADRDTSKNPTILDGKGTHRVITQNFSFADSMAVVVDGFTIQNGSAVNGGGLHLAGNVTINNCIVKGNKASNYSTAIYASNVTIKNCQIIGNSYINSARRTVYLNKSVMDSCVIRNNSAYEHSSVYAENGSKVSNCEFGGGTNRYGDYKGAYFNASYVSNCKFGKASGSGSCAELQNGSTMFNCVFEEITGISGNVLYVGARSLADSCQFIGNTTSGDLFYLYDGGKLNRCRVIGNSVSNRLMYAYYSSTVSNSLFINNKCQYSGNPLYFYNGLMINCTVANNTFNVGQIFYLYNSTLKNSVVVGNTRPAGYSTILSLDGTNTVTHNMLESTVIGTDNIDGSMKLAAFADPENGDYSLSEKSYCINAGVDVADTIDLLGSPRNQGGAVDLGAIESAYTETVSFVKCGEIVYVKEGSEGDGSSWESAFGDLHEAMVAASADKQRHQIWVAAGTYTGDSTLSSVVNLSRGISLYGGFAGTETSIADRDTAKNPTVLDGGKARMVISQNYGFPDSMAVVIDGFTIQNGKAVNGAGLNISKNTTVNNCIIRNNVASNIGMALCAYNATVKNCQIYGNSHTDSGERVVYLSNSVLDSCVIKNNTARYYGSIYAEGGSRISNTLFESNSSVNSYYSNRNSYFNNSTIENCQFVGSTGRGGTVDVENKSTMRNCLFENNKGVDYQILYVNSYSVAEDCQILNNQTNGELFTATNSSQIRRFKISGNKCGGRIYGSSGATIITNTEFSNNESTSTNEPFYLYDRTSMINCTVVKNSTKASKFVYMGYLSSVDNSIMVGNTFANGYSFYFYFSSTDNVVSHSMIEGGAEGEGNITGSMTLAAFANADSSDYSLSSRSLCINAGVDVNDSIDLLGNLRKQSDAVDMGAIESPYDSLAKAELGEIIYVKAGSEGDGTSWESAFGDIQQAMVAASLDGNKHQIWVAAGTYYGDTTLTEVVSLEKGISLYGGFAGNETSVAARDTAKNPTILDGKNKRRVISQNYNFADSMAVVVDGFTIQNGTAVYGGGAYLMKNVTVNNCVFRNNHASENGQAVYSLNGKLKNSVVENTRYIDFGREALYFKNGLVDSCIVRNNHSYYRSALYGESMTVSNTIFDGNEGRYENVIEVNNSSMRECKITNNTSNYYALRSYSSSKVDRCIIENNVVNSHVLYQSGSAKISNSQITKNTSKSSHLIYFYDKPLMYNCTVADNESRYSTVNFGSNSSVIKNSVIVGNKRTDNSASVTGNCVVTYSMIEGGANGEGNIDGSRSSAAFKDASKGDYSLSETSLCINAGTDVDEEFDLLGNERKQSDAVDMGAIESEFTERAAVGTVIYVKAGSEGSGLSWDDALGEINQAVTLASTTGKTHQIWVAAGTYYGDTSLTSAISLSAGVNLYGGFAGTESSLDERDAATNTTVIDGRYKRRCIIQNYDFADSLSIVVDGFTIQNGYMKGSAGVNAKTMGNTTFSNCIFRNAREGNECVYADKSAFKNCKFTENLIQDLEIYSGIVDSCSFSGNTSTQGSKVVYINNTKMSNSDISGHKTGYGALEAVNSSVVSNCKIFDNKALYDHVVYIENSTLQNSYVYGNVASYSGYSIIIANYKSFITNSTVAHNKTKNRSAISYSYSSSKQFSTIANSIIYGNKVTDEVRPQVVVSDYVKVKYSASDGDLTGEKNIKLATANSGSDESQKYVCFINAAGGDYRLHATSSCIDQGLDSVMTAQVDINGGARIYGKAIDLGASEYDGEYVQMLDYSQVVCHNGTSLEATFDSTITKIDWKIEYAGHVTGFEETSGTGLTIPAMQLSTSKSDVDTLTLKVTPYDKDGVAGTVFNYNYFVYPDFSKKKVTFARPQVAYVVNEQNANMTIEWNLLKLPVEVDNYDLYVWKASQKMPSVPMASYVKDHVKNLSGLDNHTTYKYMVKAAIACDTICSDVDSFRIDIPVSLEVNGNINCVFGSKLNETSSLTRYVKGFELTDSISYEITGKDAADFSAKYEDGWDKLKGGYLRIYYTPTDVKKQTSDAEITIRSGKSGKYEITLYLAGTLSNYYVYDAVVAKDVYHAGDTVDVVGILTDAYGNPMSGKTLTIEATSNTGFSHSTTGMTDTTGMAPVSFATTKNECGTYTVKVYVGSKSENAATAKFDIPGMAYTGGTTKWTIQKGDTIDGTITITNRSSVDLHNLVVEARELADGLSVEFDTVKLLKGTESARISFKATGTKLTEGKMYLPSVFRVSNDESTTCDFSTYFYCEHPYGQIKVSPTDINEYVSKQKAKYINLELTNAGFGETGEITLSMPDFDGFSVPSTTLPSIKSGDTARVALKLAYYPGAPINVPFTGSIGVNCANGKSTSLPFRIEYSSESKGSLEVDVVDEYYYNTADKKHLNGAKVVVRNQYNNKEVASGISDSTGVVRFDSIPEGSYLLSVKADKHSEYQETIEIQAGQQLDKFVFLAYQAITYNWKVERVEIEDKYDITLDLEYETNIPAPVVTLSFPNGVPSKERFEIGVPKTVRLQITNHGLIAAHYVKFGLPKCPYYRFYAPYNYIDSLPANHTEFVPITIVRTEEKFAPMPGYDSYINENGGVILEDGELYGESECPSVHAEYSYVCGVLRKLSTVSENAWGCPYLVPVGGGGYASGGFNIPSYGGSTGGGYNGNVQNHGHAVNWDLPCNSCQSKIDPWGCIGNVLGYVPIIGPALEWGTGKLHDAIKEDSENRKKRQSCEVQVDEKDDWFESLNTPINDYTFDKNTPEDLKNKIQTVRSVYNVNVDAPKGGDDDGDDEFISASIGDLQTIYTGTKLVCKGINGELDPYEGVDFVWDQAKDFLGDKVKVPYIKTVPWDCIDLACQVASCEAGRYAENCGRYVYDRIAGNNEEDEDTREALTDEGDVVEIENGQIKDIKYADGTKLSDENNTKSEKMEKAKAPFRMKNSSFKMADSHTLAVQDAVEFTGMLKYRGCMMKEFAGSESALSINGIVDYFDYTIPSYTNRKKIDIDSIKKLPTMDLSTTEMVEMAQRWNETLVANENGVYSPNEQYPNIVDYSVISAYMDSIVNFYAYMTFRGFDMVNDMLVSINKEANKPTQKSVCASVKLQISQTLTMTREAFDGTLTVNNGNESGAMEGFKVVLEVRNDKGELSNDLFQINTEKLTGVTAVDGTGEIAPKSEGTALFRFIPEKGAAPKAPVNYSFGGYIVYVDPSSGDTVKADLYPVTLTVNPSPDLQIDYFMQRNILGDDALTLDRVEPSVPAALGVRIDNQGYGDAKKVKLETAQPEIVDNEKGLLIDFAIIGSSLNGKDCDLGSENIDFGNIEAQSAKTGVWWLTSSLLGHFTKYEASVVHANSFGNPELSLVSGIAIHELIKTVDAYGEKEDNVTDFLVNDIEDENDTPDALYYSNGGKDAVVRAQSTKLDKKKVSASDTMITLTVTPSNSGWNYAQMDDPGDNCFEIQKVVRVKDSVEIPLDNVWTTFVTLPDGAEPIYVNRLHFLDYMTVLGENDYNIYYSVKKNVLNVAEISGIPETEVAVTSPVDSVIVKFDHKIQKESFDYNDIELFCQGGDNLSDSTITVAQRDDYTYVVNIASKTTKSGFYKIEVNVDNVYDQNGYPGNLGKNATWSQLIDDVIIPDTVVTDTITPVIPDTIVPIIPDTVVTDTITPVIPDTIVPIIPDTVVTDTITPVIPDTIVPIIPDTVVTDTITPVIPDTIVPIIPDTVVTDTITPVIPDTIVPIIPDTTVTDTIIPVIPDTIVPIIPDTVVTDTITPVIPDTIVPIIPDTVVTDTITPVIPDTIVPIIPDTVVTDTITPVIPDTIVPIIPDTVVTDTITPVIPDTIVPINPDTTVTDTIIPVIPDTIVPINPDTTVTDTIIPVIPDTIVPIIPDTLVTDTITPVIPDTIVPIIPDTIVNDTTGFEDMINDVFIVYASQGCVYIKSTKSGTVDIYDILSRLIVKSAAYSEGVTMVATLPKGIYIIEGKKIFVR